MNLRKYVERSVVEQDMAQGKIYGSISRMIDNIQAVNALLARVTMLISSVLEVDRASGLYDHSFDTILDKLAILVRVDR